MNVCPLLILILAYNEYTQLDWLMAYKAISLLFTDHVPWCGSYNIMERRKTL